MNNSFINGIIRGPVCRGRGSCIAYLLHSRVMFIFCIIVLYTSEPFCRNATTYKWNTQTVIFFFMSPSNLARKSIYPNFSFFFSDTSKQINICSTTYKWWRFANREFLLKAFIPLFRPYSAVINPLFVTR